MAIKNIGPFKSMVTDSYTQYNSNGIGVSITNRGYAQIVSLFTINTDVGVSVQQVVDSVILQTQTHHW